ncbi:hypothetical protein G4Y79_09130 [Phototrophicus methaneseepsis]|uniref:Uncharacterized protein n=1 Tax=Phototrophicus methaneseepsis TaxID=2710758 RepID=A0A7S8ECQ2_9CHLR|nr:hypothetical protein G4Y79_09130 [Phototrophicus methaneseepsis]
MTASCHRLVPATTSSSLLIWAHSSPHQNSAKQSPVPPKWTNLAW